jgi:hypothetical protein
MRSIAGFLFWLGLFGLFLSIAAFTTGSERFDLVFASLVFIAVSAWMLRKPAKKFEPYRRFRSLRKLGLIGGNEEVKED